MVMVKLMLETILIMNISKILLKCVTKMVMIPSTSVKSTIASLWLKTNGEPKCVQMLNKFIVTDHLNVFHVKELGHAMIFSIFLTKLSLNSIPTMMV